MSPTICVDQFVAAPPEKVWRLLTEPDLLRRWWAEGEVAAVVGHQFELDMPGFGKQPCKVLEVDPPRRFVYTFTAAWTLAWTLEPEGAGTGCSWSTVALIATISVWPMRSCAWGPAGAMWFSPAWRRPSRRLPMGPRKQPSASNSASCGSMSPDMEEQCVLS